MFIESNKCIYSPRLGTLSPAQLQAMLDRFELGRLVYAEPIESGFSKQNVFVTSTCGEFVLRGNSSYPWQYLTEQFFARQLHERTQVPAPWPYLVDRSTDIFGWGYALMPRLTGLQLSDSRVRKRLSAADRQGIAHAMGEGLALLQELTWSHSGRYDVQSGTIRPLELQQELRWPYPSNDNSEKILQPTEVTYSERILARIHYFLTRAATYNARTTQADIQWVEEIIANAREALDDSFQPCFVMEDYKEQNTVVECRHGIWRVNGIFDLTHAHFGDGESDLSRITAMYIDENPLLAWECIRAYVAKRQPRPGFAERFAMYMLHDRLSQWEFFQRLGHSMLWDERLTLREWAEPYVSFAFEIASIVHYLKKGEHDHGTSH